MSDNKTILPAEPGRWILLTGLTVRNDRPNPNDGRDEFSALTYHPFVRGVVDYIQPVLGFVVYGGQTRHDVVLPHAVWEYDDTVIEENGFQVLYDCARIGAETGEWPAWISKHAESVALIKPYVEHYRRCAGIALQ